MTNYTDWQMEFIEKPDLPKWVRVSSTLVHNYVFAQCDAQMLNLFWN